MEDSSREERPEGEKRRRRMESMRFSAPHPTPPYHRLSSGYYCVAFHHMFQKPEARSKLR